VTGRVVTEVGMHLRGMRLLVHRGQVLLLLVVGVLSGVAIAGVGLELCGVSVLGVLRVSELYSQPRTTLPAQIVIGDAVAPKTDSVLTGSAAANPAPTATRPPPPDAVQPTATTSIVPGPVYAYPPDDHGGHGGPAPGGGHGEPGG
jgi:hypothetical protein